jgi:hypothetical protein
VAGIAGLRTSEIAPKNPSAKLLRDWIESNTFVWLITDEIVSEYKRVMARLGVRRSFVGKIVNLLRERPNSWWLQECLISLPIPEMIRFAPALKLAVQTSL